MTRITLFYEYPLAVTVDTETGMIDFPVISPGLAGAPVGQGVEPPGELAEDDLGVAASMFAAGGWPLPGAPAPEPEDE